MDAQTGYKRLFLGFFVVVILAVGGAILVYLYGGNFRGGLSQEHTSWAEFGSYFGGVVGSLMAVASVILIAWTLALQGIQLEGLQYRQHQQTQMDHVTIVSAQLEAIIGREWVFGNKHWSLGMEMDGMLGDKPPPSKSIHLITRARVADLLPHYAEAIRIYVSNYHLIGAIRYHHARLNEIYQWLSTHSDGLAPQHDIAMNFARLHIEAMNTKSQT